MHNVWRFLIYALALCIPFTLENASELAEHLPATFKDGLQNIGAIYKRWPIGPRASVARYTAVVTIEEERFKIAGSACKLRSLTADLIPLLVEAGAVEIVIDYAFSKETCPVKPQENATGRLRAALAKGAANLPIVVGQWDSILKNLSADKQARFRSQGFKENGLLALPIIDLPSLDSGSEISVGLLRFNLDMRKVPLTWTTYEERGDSLSPAEARKTLSFQAALKYREPFPKGTAELDRLEQEGRHPLTSFLAREKFIEVKAADLFCETTQHELSPCPQGPPKRIARHLRGKVIVMGSEDTDDQIETPVGTLPGRYAQANYIESLLDSRYLRVVSIWWQLGISILWFGLIELSFFVYRDSPERALLGAVIGIVVGAFFFYYVAVVNLGFYLALLPPSFVAVLLRCWYQWSERSHERSSTNREEVCVQAGPGASVTSARVESGHRETIAPGVKADVEPGK